MVHVTDDVLIELRGHVLVITINRPEVKNALNASVAQKVADAVDEMDADPNIRVGVLTGAGGVFSAGMDLKAFLKGESPAVTGRGLCGITTTPPRTPLVAAVEGWALAGGLELMLACDLAVAAETARLGVPEVKRSLVAGGGGAFLLPRRLAPVHAMELLLTGEPISGTRAAEIGLVNYATPEGKALDRALELARIIAENGPLALTATKEIARSAPDWGFAEGWERQMALVRSVMNSEDAREGATAFAERRSPVFKGR